MKLLLITIATALAWSQAIPLAKLDTAKFKIDIATLKGKEVTHVSGPAEGNSVVAVKGATFKDGTIEVEVAGQPAATAGPAARGFVGIAFRTQANGKYEVIYLRPTNGRADDMLRRNHSTQYASEPEWPWQRLRNESPGVYESYVDLEPGVLTRYKIVVKGTSAELYVHGAAQPCLIVKDLKLGDVSGGVSLWIGPGSEAHFANLKITP